MAKPSSSSLLLTFYLLTVATMLFSAAAATGDIDLSWIPLKPRCEGSIAECMAEEEEFGMESESNRRILATSNYISYGALQRNSVPCSRRGASYYNCRQGGQANSYNRGCSTITRCRS